LAERENGDNSRKMGRKRLWDENMHARFRAGIFARITKVLRDGEDRTDFVREAVDRELERRETQKNGDE